MTYKTVDPGDLDCRMLGFIPYLNEFKDSFLEFLPHPYKYFLRNPISPVSQLSVEGDG